MIKVWIGGLIAVTVSAPALAGGHYIEVWNPPEARAGARHPNVIPAKRVRHRHVRTALTQANARHSDGVPATLPNIVTGPKAHDRGPSVDDLPRLITPEGNVLRVGGAAVEVRVER